MDTDPAQRGGLLLIRSKLIEIPFCSNFNPSQPPGTSCSFMQCNQLIRLVKEWYTHVGQETMAPARMMQFVENHVKECGICREDRDLGAEIDRIRERVLPDSKLARTFRFSPNALTPDIFPIGEEEDSDPQEDSDADGLF